MPIIYYWHTPDSPMMAPASTLVLFNKNIANFTHKRWENQCSKFFGFFTALLVDRHKRGRLRHRGG